MWLRNSTGIKVQIVMRVVEMAGLNSCSSIKAAYLSDILELCDFIWRSCSHAWYFFRISHHTLLTMIKLLDWCRWQMSEMISNFNFPSGASCLDDRIRQVLRSTPGTQPWYERYIRVFCREIFLDKACDLAEKGFWLCKVLKPWPLVFQARLLYILYGPVNDDNGK